jgi:flagellar protein FlaG
MTEPVTAITRSVGLNDSSTNYHVLASTPKHTEPAQKVEASQKLSIERVVEVLQSYMESNNTSLDISVHEATGDIVVKVISDEDGRVIREIPSEEVLNRAAMMEQLQGFMFDETV